jgi:phytoene dehydrogenase-like protein
VYLACPTAPFDVDGGWDGVADAFADRMINTVETRVPGFRDTIVGRAVRTPTTMVRELRWPGAHPMYLDVSLDQLGPLRPSPALGRHRTPVRGLYVSGAGTTPVGGISGVPGRGAARALLRTLTERRHQQRPDGVAANFYTA